MINRNKINVLVISDSKEDISSFIELLSDKHTEKVNVTGSVGLNNGLERISKGDIEVIVTKLISRDKNNPVVIQKIRGVAEDLPIIVFDDEGSDDLTEYFIRAGAQDYILKDQWNSHLVYKSIVYVIERKNIEKKLSDLTQFDGLTNLPNRGLFRERLRRALVRAKRNNKFMALMVIDLDRFKNINDTLGHDAGDRLLVDVSNRLRRCTRGNDTVARLGGDEFTIILEDLKQVNDAAVVAKNILDALQPAIELDNHDIYITPSIGVTIFPLDDISESNLLRNADAAMYRAKEQGRNGFQFYTAGMNTRTVERLKLEAELRRALDNDEFILFFQPKVNIRNREIIGVEALIRWNHPEHGFISPLDFIPLAEETGLILPIGEWAIRTACKQVAMWEGQGFDNLRMAVNLSARQFKETDITKLILESAIHSNIRPEKIEIEITESMLMDDTETTISILRELKNHGLHISIDDFGTGYSSLSYLKRFNIDTLKIDQSFVMDITTNPDDAAIAAAIIALGKSLRLNVVAEGVETEEQLGFLRANGCNEAQGYLFSKPVSADDISRLLSKNTYLSVLPSVLKFA